MQNKWMLLKHLGHSQGESKFPLFKQKLTCSLGFFLEIITFQFCLGLRRNDWLHYAKFLQVILIEKIITVLHYLKTSQNYICCRMTFFLLQAMGVYLYGELMLNEDAKQQEIAYKTFATIRDQMDASTAKVVAEMLSDKVISPPPPR